MTEDEFVRVVKATANILYRQFGKYHGCPEDFQQQVAVWALQAMPKYDPKRQLDNYLYSHARNRALNWIRDHYSRSDPPCAKCHACSPCGEDGGFCKLYEKWRMRNQLKANIACPVGLEYDNQFAGAPPVEEEAVERELRQKIDRNLPIELRANYLRMLAGEKVPKHLRERVQKAVTEILEADNQDNDGDVEFKAELLHRIEDEEDTEQESMDRTEEAFSENSTESMWLDGWTDTSCSRSSCVPFRF